MIINFRKLFSLQIISYRFSPNIFFVFLTLIIVNCYDLHHIDNHIRFRIVKFALDSRENGNESRRSFPTWNATRQVIIGSLT